VNITPHDPPHVPIYQYAVTVKHFAVHYYTVLSRNPSPDSRPSFPDALIELQHPDFKMLMWAPEDVAAYSEQARTLGAPLEAGEELYRDLQISYA